MTPFHIASVPVLAAALKAAGIEMPFPQRDVTLRFPPQEQT